MRRVFKGNVGLKLSSILLAYLLWIIVVGRPPRAELISVEVRFDAGPSLLVVDHDPKRIDMRVVGDRSFWDEDRLREVFVQMDVANLGAGRFQRSVGRLDVEKLPLDFEVNILTTTIDFEIEEKSSAQVRVEPAIAGDIPPGYRIIGVEAVPATVNAEGPLSQIESLERVRTEPVVVEGRRARLTRKVRVASPQEKIVVEPLMVDVNVDIEELRESRTLTLPVTPPVGSWRIEPAVVEVELTGPALRIDELVTSARAAVAIDPGVARMREAAVEVIFPGLDPDVTNRVEIVSLSPATVDVARSSDR